MDGAAPVRAIQWLSGSVALGRSDTPTLPSRRVGGHLLVTPLFTTEKLEHADQKLESCRRSSQHMGACINSVAWIYRAGSGNTREHASTLTPIDASVDTNTV